MTTKSIEGSGFNTENDYDVKTQDVEYRSVDGTDLMATVYQPQGPGPFPLLIDIHGGGWGKYERLRDAGVDAELASCGIVVAALDFRLNGQAPHPAAIGDINYGIRWFKAHAAEFNASADVVGTIGYSSGGHQSVMCALRPDYGPYVTDAVYDDNGQEVDATLTYAIACGCIFDVVAVMLGTTHDEYDHYGLYEYFGKIEGVRSESPIHILERGEKVRHTPLLIVQAGADLLSGGRVSDATSFASAYAASGANVELAIMPGASHIFINPGLVERSEAMVRGLAIVKGYIARQLSYQAAPFEASGASTGPDRPTSD